MASIVCTECQNCQCVLIDINCLYTHIDVPATVQIERQHQVVKLATERTRTLMRVTCYNDFCTAVSELNKNNTPLPTKWSDLYENADFKSLYANYILDEYYKSPQGRGYVFTGVGLQKTENAPTQKEIDNLRVGLQPIIEMYEQRVRNLLSQTPYDCINTSDCGCDNNCGCNDCTPSKPCGVKPQYKTHAIIIL